MRPGSSVGDAPRVGDGGCPQKGGLCIPSSGPRPEGALRWVSLGGGQTPAPAWLRVSVQAHTVSGVGVGVVPGALTVPASAPWCPIGTGSEWLGWGRT